MATSYKQLIENYTKSVNSNKSLSAAEKQAKLTAIQNWARAAGVITTKRNPDGSETFSGWTNRANLDTASADPRTKDIFTKATGLEWGTGKKTTTPQKELEARKSFVNSNPKKVTPEVVARQENNITNFDQGTAAGQGRNTEAAKKAQEAQRDARRAVNEVKQDGVADVPVTDDRSDAYYEDGTEPGGNATGGEVKQIPGTNGNPSETATAEERQGNMNGLLLADMLMTGVRNALHYRPSFRTAYGTSYDGQEFGNEKSLAGRMAEENMKRGLERMNARQDYRAQQEEQIAATKAKGGDAGYLAAEQALTRNVSPTQKQWSNSSSNILGSQANAGATTEWDNPNALAQRVQSSR